MMDEISKTYIVIEVDDHESSISENVDNALIESIWEDLDGHVDREYIRRAVLGARARYQHATIKTFKPIFTRRYVLDKLHQSRLKDRTRASG